MTSSAHGDSTLGSKKADIADFFSMNIDGEALAKISDFVSVRDKNKRALAAFLLNRWMLCPVGKDSVYIKHVASERKNVFYQIVLSGQDWDGVYEFRFKGMKIKIEAQEIDNEHSTLLIQSRGNYELAVLKGNKTVCRMDFENDEDFCTALTETGLVTKEDLEIYYRPDPLIKPYLDKRLPRIIFK